MKITFLVSAMHGGGAERVISVLASSLAEKGHEVTIAMCAGDECLYSLSPSVRLISIGEASGNNPLKILRRLFNMRRLMARNPGVHFVSFSTNINIFSSLAYLSLSDRSKPIGLILSERGDPHIYKHPALRDMIYKLANKKGACFAFQTHCAKDCFAFVKSGTATVIPNPLKQDLPTSPDFEGREHKLFVAVGRLDPLKNYPLLLRAFAAFVKDHQGYHLSLYGEGSLREELQSLVISLGIQESVSLEGFCADVNERIKNAGAFIMTSDHEGMPNAMMEAMAMGIPTIATDCPIGGPAMLSQENERALLVPTGDEKSLIGAMEKIASDTKYAKKLSLAAQVIRELYSTEKITGLWEELLYKMQ